MQWTAGIVRAPGRAVALGVVAAAMLLRILDLGIVPETRLRVFDLEQRVWPRTSDPARVVVVDIDEKSLAQYGQWPWPRTLVAELVRRIGESRPRVLGIDIVFAEPDRLSPPEIVRELPGLPGPLAKGLAQLPPNELALAEAMRTVSTVLAMVPGREDTGAPPALLHAAPIRQEGGAATPFLVSYGSLLRSLPELATAAVGAGAIAADPDHDGVVRRAALAVSHRGTVIPSFALEILRVGGAERSIVIETGRFGIEAVRIGGVVIPTDRRGHAIIHFAPRLARYVSASDILNPRFDLAELQSKVVLLGVAGLGIADLQHTPLGLVQGLDIHAQLIESILLDALLHRPPYIDWIELGATLIVGLLGIWVLRYDRPIRAAVIALAVIISLIGLEFVLFRWVDLLFDGTYPAATFLAAFGVMLVGTLRAAEAELSREREQKQRLEGELSAAQRIQMGLLPQHFPAFPDRPEIDVYARVEPARIVGGDLYDYLFVNGHRCLFFLIADVAGKGAPAALLMATTKEVIREAALKYGGVLDRVFAEASRKTMITSAELESEGGVFVTAFAGLLDIATGDLVYVSAGHDSPFVIAGDRHPRLLETAGGPPLGAVEDFAYPIDRDRIGPGEVLLLYTDGVTEAEDASHALYGRERLRAILAKAPIGDARSVVAIVMDDLLRFVGRAEQADDITLLALRLVTVR